MSVDDLYRTVMVVAPPDGESPLDAAERNHLLGDIWSRPGLSIRDRRFVTIVCASAAVDVGAIDAHVYAALASGDLTIEQMNELTLHFAVYSDVATQWQADQP